MNNATDNQIENGVNHLDQIHGEQPYIFVRHDDKILNPQVDKTFVPKPYVRRAFKDVKEPVKSFAPIGE